MTCRRKSIGLRRRFFVDEVLLTVLITWLPERREALVNWNYS